MMSRWLCVFLVGAFVPCVLLLGCTKQPESLGSQPQEEPDTPPPFQQVLKTDPPPYPVPKGMVWIPGGSFEMGGDKNSTSPDEFPVHVVELDGYYIDKTEVTNAEFLKFVEATKYVTMAERKPELRSLKKDAPKIEIPMDGKFSKPGSVCLNPNLIKGNLDPRKGAYNWWDYLPGANWRHPEGPDSSIMDRMNHPVVHVSWLDVQEYCKWAGKALPTEAQWEFASRGKLPRKTYAWGNDRNPNGKWVNNIWQGDFPFENTKKDGFRTTAPVGSFPANGYGLSDMSGNVWEWVADYYRPDYYANSPRKNPRGPKSSLDPAEPFIIKRVQRGGSFMCSDSYCVNYRNSARMKGEEDTGAFHTGFRCIITPEMLKQRQASQSQKPRAEGKERKPSGE